LAKTEKTFSNNSSSHIAIYPKWEKLSWRAYMRATIRDTHPRVLGEVEDYKNNLVFPQDS
jgi:hypothetical protein